MPRLTSLKSIPYLRALKEKRKLAHQSHELRKPKMISTMAAAMGNHTAAASIKVKVRVVMIRNQPDLLSSSPTMSRKKSSTAPGTNFSASVKSSSTS